MDNTKAFDLVTMNNTLKEEGLVELNFRVNGQISDNHYDLILCDSIQDYSNSINSRIHIQVLSVDGNIEDHITNGNVMIVNDLYTYDEIIAESL
jgi:hypothetical protein